MRRWLIILMMWAGYEIQWRADRLGHLATDPACREYRAPRPGSRLDRASRGLSCGECMVTRAFGWDEVTDPMNGGQL